MKDLPELSALQAFVGVVESGSFTHAARKLAIPRATLTRRISRLEEDLGVRLITRSTRRLQITDAGQSFYGHACNVLSSAQQAVSSVLPVAGDRLRGSLKVSVPPRIGRGFQELVTRFVEAHPEVRLKLHCSTHFVDLRRDHYDVVIRAGQDFDGGLISRTLLRTSLCVVASPGYITQYGTPQDAQALATHRCVVGFARGETPQTHWPLWGGERLAVEGATFSNEVEFMRTLVLNDLGLALLPKVLVSQDIDSGKLIHVLPDVIGADVRVALLYMDRALIPPQVQRFIDLVLAWAKDSPEHISSSL